MPTIEFSVKALKHLKPPSRQDHGPIRQVDYWDSSTPGFGLRLSSTGVRTWTVMGRVMRAGKVAQIRHGIGPYAEKDSEPGLTLAVARMKAHEVRRLIEEGGDPGQIRQERIRQQQETDANTFLGCTEKFLKLYVPKNKPRLRERTLKEYTRHLLVDFKALHEMPIVAITKRDVNHALDQIQIRAVGVGVNRALATIRKLFNWLTDRGEVETPPTAGIRPRAPEIQRKRHLFGDADYGRASEIALFWRACDRIGAAGSFAKVLLLTGQRRDEVARATWPELLDVTGDNARWALPADRAKNWKDHLVPLGSLAVEVIRSTPHIVGCKYVFSSDGRTPRSGFNKIKRDLDKAIVALKKEDPQKYRGQFDESWRLHDLRRTAKTGMADLGVLGDVRDAVFNHAPPQAMDRIYVHATYTAEKRDAMMKWEKHIRSLLANDEQETGASDSRVIEMHHHREKAAG
jgi:integrase